MIETLQALYMILAISVFDYHVRTVGVSRTLTVFCNEGMEPEFMALYSLISNRLHAMLWQEKGSGLHMLIPLPKNTEQGQMAFQFAAWLTSLFGWMFAAAIAIYVFLLIANCGGDTKLIYDTLVSTAQAVCSWFSNL